MATSSYIPVITRKKRVPDKYNPNTYRVVAYDENDDSTKYPEVPGDIRKTDPLGVQVNKRPDMLCHSSQVLPYDLPDHRANKPYPKNCNFLRQNSRTLNEPVCFVETRDQPTGHWIAPQLPDMVKHSPSYKLDTVFRRDFCDEMPGTCEKFLDANSIQTTSLKSFHLNNLQEKDINIKEKISYEHCYNSRADQNYPLRGKRHGTFVWTKEQPPSTVTTSYHSSHVTNFDEWE